LTAVPESALLRRALPAAIVILGVLSSCAGERPKLADETSTTTSTTEATTTTTEPTPPAAERAEAKEMSIDVYASEDAPDPERQLVSGVDTSVDTIPIVFLVKSRQEGDPRLEVYLPVPPAGSTGWVNADEVTLTSVPYKILVELDAHRLRVLRDEKVLLDAPVGVGRADVPAPGGTYYLKELLAPPNPAGAYGPYAYGLSGASNVLQGFERGSGVVAIHGTDQPEEVGTDVSQGCIVLENENLVKMVDEIGLPLGTPVEIKA